MTLLEPAALAIVALFVVVRARVDAEPRRVLLRLAALATASWIAEDSAVRLYGFYFYDARWSLFLDQVPLAIVLIWPVVIHSAWELARALAGPTRWLALIGGALVLADASLIEPIAVQSGLWRWTEPGVFSVPPIGVLGWSFHGALCMLVLERAEAARSPWRPFAALLTPLGTHLLLLASWWGSFRWLSAPLPPWPFVAVAWALSLALATVAALRSAGARVPLRDLLLRMPAAGFFFVLLALDGGAVPLVAYALAFAPPYLVLVLARRAAVAPRERALANDPG